MPNTVTIRPDDIIYFVFEGDQDGDTVMAVMKEMMSCAEKISLAGKKILMLGNIDGTKKHNAAARKAGLEMSKQMKFDRIAMTGGNVFTRNVAKLVITATGDKRIKFFSAREEAEVWLKSA
ncbi:MAG: STAS/SEC14 domain-containing protein [Bacteroidetes bacterium]|nr:STAS/SEC14 domain-containing protein [Bacteroidota bacterium]